MRPKINSRPVQVWVLRAADGFGTLVTHLVPIGDFAGPYLFDGGGAVA